ncbi:hypothetical protein Leryth_017174 [Lithospermum erythrorhizon]|nr:hypothetical protein Leryth_017174 [Lithospermum erythrorhizon]
MELCCGATTITRGRTDFGWSKSVNNTNPSTTNSFSSSQYHKSLRILCNNNGDIDAANQMTVSITGATGFIGRRLVQRLHADNHVVRVLTRSRPKAETVFPVKEFPGIVIAEMSDWKDCIQGSTAVVNLAGEPVSTRWSHQIKKDIKDSRINITSKIVGLINNLQDGTRPKVFISASAVGYYGTSETKVLDEESPSGNDYLAEVCKEWETTAFQVNNEVRLALVRIGVVLGKDGGALAKMVPIFMMFAGGPPGSGNQWFSWIHLDDIVNLIYEAICNPSYKGVINGTAPNPVRMSEMCQNLGSVLGRPSWLPVPDIALKALLGEGASVVLEGQRVLPSKAKELGFPFRRISDSNEVRKCVDPKSKGHASKRRMYFPTCNVFGKHMKLMEAVQNLTLDAVKKTLFALDRNPQNRPRGDMIYYVASITAWLCRTLETDINVPTQEKQKSKFEEMMKLGFD